MEFAEPLLYADPAGPPNIAAFRSVVQLAEMCWNLPVLEASKSPLYPSARKTFHQALGAMPSLASRLLRRLIDDRKRTLSAMPFAVALRVEGTSLDDVKVVAAGTGSI